MNWTEVKQSMKQEIMNDKPVAKLNADGSISLEVSENFYETLDRFCDAGKAEVKKSAFQIAILSALGLGGAVVAVNVDPSMMNTVIALAHAYALGGGFYILNALNKKKEAKYYYDHLEEEFLKEAEEKYQKNQYYTIREDGTIEFDKDVKETSIINERKR